jgi:cell division protein FtsB
MMAEIEEEMARAAALEAFLQKLEDEKAAAAAATAAYRASLEDEVIGELVVEDEVIVGN